MFTKDTTTVAEVNKFAALTGIVAVGDALISIDGVPTTPKILSAMSNAKFKCRKSPFF